MNYVLVFIGGGMGSTLRYLVNVVTPRLLGSDFPYHTFIINITGSTVMGLIAGYLAFKGDAAQSWRLFLMTGILGGYTTFSTYALEGVLLFTDGSRRLATMSLVGSVLTGLCAAAAGAGLAQLL